MFLPIKLEDIQRGRVIDLQKKISALCDAYGIDNGDCARELFSFVATFGRLNDLIRTRHSDDDSDKEMVGGNENDDANDDDILMTMTGKGKR